MWNAIKRLTPGVGLIVLAAAALLLSDTNRRKPAASDLPRVALLQHTSQPALDDGVRGVLDGLAQAGFEDGRTMSLRHYNADGDGATSNTIATEIAGAHYDLVITISTLSLQAMANANRAGKTRHVFALVSDPYGSGVGISAADHMDHPPWMTGYGSMQPVARTFAVAREVFPGLQRVGVIWNPTEHNSEANTLLARQVCRELGIELLEANADNSASVAEAARSLIGRDVQALWVGGDLTVMTAVDGVVSAARNARIPVFTSMMGVAERGGLFDVGPDFVEVGQLAGQLAGRVLKGTDPATVPVDNLMPERFAANDAATEGLRDPWRFPEALLARAVRVGKNAPAASSAPVRKPGAAAPLARLWNVDVLQYISSVDVEDAERGIRKGLQDAGLVEARDYALRVRNANGDMPTLSTLVDAALTDGSDLLVTFSSPTLQAAVQRARNLPIVFTYVANPMAAGAGRSNDDHLPNVTGVATLGPYEELLGLIRQCLPKARRLGTLVVPAEVNSIFNRDLLRQLAPAHGFEVVEVAVNASSEVSDATLSLLSQGVDAICQAGANMTNTAFASIAMPARQARVPVFSTATSNLKEGATVVAARDYFDGGHQAGLMAARVMRGERPATLPFETLETTRILVNLDAARNAGMTVPESVLARAEQIIGRK